jgi:hypothetical protein
MMVGRVSVCNDRGIDKGYRYRRNMYSVAVVASSVETSDGIRHRLEFSGESLHQHLQFGYRVDLRCRLLPDPSSMVTRSVGACVLDRSLPVLEECEAGIASHSLGLSSCIGHLQLVHTRYQLLVTLGRWLTRLALAVLLGHTVDLLAPLAIGLGRVARLASSTSVLATVGAVLAPSVAASVAASVAPETRLLG